jgi:signal transduction histidine kinase
MPSARSSSSSSASVEERILLLAATPERADRLAALLRGMYDRVASFTALPALTEALEEGAGTLIVEEDAITKRAVRLLSSAMAQRAAWSNLPIVILTTGEPDAIERLDRLDLFGPATASNITILERPVHEVTLATVVQSALRARRRQYEVRDLMDDLRSMNEQLRTSQAALQSVNETLEERVRTRTEQTRRLALALTAAERRERARISEILHDHVQQLIHGARIWADTLMDQMDADPPEALDRLIELLREASEAIRSLSVELSPPMLQSDGLGPALQWLASHVETLHGLQLTVDLPPTLEVPTDDLRTLLFRSVRELVFNVVKHAGVDTATVRVRCDEAACVIEVQDDGVGFDPARLTDETDPNGHFGLFSIRERLDLVGGTLTIDAAPGEGTRARIEVPLEESL